MYGTLPRSALRLLDLAHVVPASQNGVGAVEDPPEEPFRSHPDREACEVARRSSSCLDHPGRSGSHTRCRRVPGGAPRGSSARRTRARTRRRRRRAPPPHRCPSQQHPGQQIPDLDPLARLQAEQRLRGERVVAGRRRAVFDLALSSAAQSRRRAHLSAVKTGYTLGAGYVLVELGDPQGRHAGFGRARRAEPGRA